MQELYFIFFGHAVFRPIHILGLVLFSRFLIVIILVERAHNSRRHDQRNLVPQKAIPEFVFFFRFDALTVSGLLPQ